MRPCHDAQSMSKACTPCAPGVIAVGLRVPLVRVNRESASLASNSYFAQGVEIEKVLAELRARFGTSGIKEKASRYRR